MVGGVASLPIYVAMSNAHHDGWALTTVPLGVAVVVGLALRERAWRRGGDREGKRQIDRLAKGHW